MSIDVANQSMQSPDTSARGIGSELQMSNLESGDFPNLSRVGCIGRNSLPDEISNRIFVADIVFVLQEFH